MSNTELQSLADKLKQTYEEISPLIETYTARHCPDCLSVCCMDRHGTHEPLDLVYLSALEEKVEGFLEKPLLNDTLQCRYMGDIGCKLKRWQRPHRCTWYFCTTLLEHMPRENPRLNRQLVEQLKRLQEIWNKISEIGG